MSGRMFTRFNNTGQVGPIVISVPHGGRDYADFIQKLRVPLSATRALEDRYADRLVDVAVAEGIPTIVAHAPRLAIDLNRAPEDIDPAMIRGQIGGGTPLSAKARSGLGLIPARLAGTGSLWRTPFDAAEVSARLSTIHEPYHVALGDMIASAQRCCGTAILLDLHSMPPIGPVDAPDVVIGDRFGRTASAHITETAAASLSGHGLRVACNAPYAGGYIVTRHANPAANIHALQIEFDRRLYLDATLDNLGPGLSPLQNVVRVLVNALTEELAGTYAAAAE
jgi:N-formylglutamate amidohydrolase